MREQLRWSLAVQLGKTTTNSSSPHWPGWPSLHPTTNSILLPNFPYIHIFLPFAPPATKYCPLQTTALPLSSHKSIYASTHMPRLCFICSLSTPPLSISSCHWCWFPPCAVAIAQAQTHALPCFSVSDHYFCHLPFPV